MKNKTIEIWRFIASILIMATHLFVIEAQTENTPFFNAWIYVDFFYMLSGYYTYKHFYMMDNLGDIEERAERAIVYSISKYIRFLPYVFCAAIIQYTLEYVKMGCRLSNFLNMPYDILLITEAFPIEDTTHILPLWYLSALMIVFPLFCILSQIKYKKMFFIFGLFIVTLYYGYFGYYGLNIRGFPLGIVRALCGLTAGMLLFMITVYAKDRIKNKSHAIYTLIAWGSFALTIIFAYKNLSAMRFYILLFGLAIVFSSLSPKTNGVKKKHLFSFSNISFALYIWHYSIGTIIRLYGVGFSPQIKILLYYVATIIVGIISIWIIDTAQKALSKFRKLKEYPSNI